MGWTQGGKYFYDEPLDGADKCNDPRGVHHLVVRVGNRIRHMTRGSRYPFSIKECEPFFSDDDLIGEPSIEMSHIGTLEITCCLKTGGVQYWSCLFDKFPDPSGDEPHPFA